MATKKATKKLKKGTKVEATKNLTVFSGRGVGRGN
jgi:hypothetical protein